MERAVEIAKLLLNAKGFISIEELAKNLNVTTRTVRTDLNLLKEKLEGSGIRFVKKRNLGVAFDKQNLSEKEVAEILSTIFEERDFYSVKERETIIMETLLLGNGGFTLKQFEELTMSSKSSVAKNLSECEKKLEKWKISVRKRPRKGMELVCTEYQWRMAALDHVMECVDEMNYHRIYENLIKENAGELLFASNGFIRQLISNKNTLWIVNFIRRYETNNKLRFTDKAFLSIFFYICIAVSRVEKGNGFKTSQFSLERIFDKTYLDQMISDNIEFLNKGMRETLTRHELEAVLVYMLSQKQVSGQGFLENVYIKDKYFKNITRDMTKNFIRTVEEYLNVNLSSDNNLYESLLLHIRPMIFRVVFGIRISNPLKEDFIKTYPVVFAACKRASSDIMKEIENEMNEDEIAYLAMCVEAVIERNRASRFSGIYRVILVCPEGKGTSSILKYRLVNRIPNIQIERICSIAELKEVHKETVDFIISTVPIYLEDMPEIIHVNPLLRDEDIAKISRTVKRLNLIKYRNRSLIVEDMMSIVSNYAVIQNYEDLQNAFDIYFNHSAPNHCGIQTPLSEFLYPAVISLQKEAKDWREAFRMSGSMLIETGSVNGQYIDCMIQNAEMYGGYMMLWDSVALPHAKPSEGVNRTAMSFLTLKHPVVFQDESQTYEIRLIITLAADRGMTHIKALGELMDIFSKEGGLETALDIDTVDEFIRYLKGTD